MTDTAPLLDPAAFQRLREWGGDELLGKLIGLFLEHAPIRMEQVEEGLRVGDLGQVVRGAHSLKSSCGNLGAEALRRMAQEMEDAAERGDATGAEELLPRFRSRYDETVTALGKRTVVQREAGE